MFGNKGIKELLGVGQVDVPTPVRVNPIESADPPPAGGGLAVRSSLTSTCSFFIVVDGVKDIVITHFVGACRTSLAVGAAGGGLADEIVGWVQVFEMILKS